MINFFQMLKVNKFCIITFAAEQLIDKQLKVLGTDICCKYMSFTPELYRLTSQIYLESEAGVSMLPGRPQLFTTQEGPVLTWDQSSRGQVSNCKGQDWNQGPTQGYNLAMVK